MTGSRLFAALALSALGTAQQLLDNPQMKRAYLGV